MIHARLHTAKRRHGTARRAPGVTASLHPTLHTDVGRTEYPGAPSHGRLDDVTSIGIRRVAPDEWEALRALRLRALADDPHAFETTLDQALAYPDSHWRESAARGASGSHSLTMAAWSGADPVAMAGGFRRGGDVRAQLAGMWVDPAHRRSGIATALVNAVIEWAAEFRLDRQHRPESGRAAVSATVHATKAGKHLVSTQQGSGRAARGNRSHRTGRVRDDHGCTGGRLMGTAR